MATAVGVRFAQAGAILPVETAGQELCSEERVVVRTAKGLELGTLVALSALDLATPTQGTVIRRPTSEDLAQEAALRERRAETLRKAQEKATEHKLAMRFLTAQWTLDGGCVTLTFWAEERVDFRSLVRELARLFRARVELHQVGDRERAKLQGGIGRCGRLLCCSTWLVQLPQITVQMAREQALLQSMPELTGVCGRLLCCLRYEYQDYLAGRAEIPPRGEHVVTPHGVGTLMNHDLMRDRVTVRVGEELFYHSAKEITPVAAGTGCADCPEASVQN